MDLGLEIRTTGRATKQVAAAEVRELRPEDLALLSEERGIQPTPLKKLRERHHALARALASGISEGEAALIVGLAGASVSILKMDPSFRELVAFYRADVDRAFTSMHNTLAALSQDAAEVLRERLEEDADELSPNQLIELVKLGADRTGFGPKSTQDVNVNVGLAQRMQEARERVAARKMIDITPEIEE